LEQAKSKPERKIAEIKNGGGGVRDCQAVRSLLNMYLAVKANYLLLRLTFKARILALLLEKERD